MNYIKFLPSIERKLPDIEILQSKLTIELMNNWINEINNRVYPLKRIPK